jgi:F-type H+-transporting ATPase subunit b
MAIDWITVSAQIVNFLILVWLLKHFLYQPVMRAMERREQRIVARLNEAGEREQQADTRIQQYQDKTQALEQEHETILDQARSDAEEEKRQMLHEARQEVDEFRINWQRQANEEKAEFLASLRRQSADAFQALARKALADLADEELEERIIHIFTERLRTLDKQLCKTLTHNAEPVHVATSFELDGTQRARITRAIHETISDGLEVDYAQTPELLCGIELSSGGHRLSWNLAEYMDGLATRIDTAFSPWEGRT